MAAAIWRVLTRPTYLLIALFVAFVNVLVFVVTRNYRLFIDVVLLGPQSLDLRLTVLINMLPVIGGGYELVSELLLVVLGMLAGLTMALFAEQFRRGHADTAIGSGGIGVLLGLTGAGCAACGAPIIAAVAGASLAGAITVLPLGGTEFAILGIILLALTIWWLANGTAGTCAVDNLDSP